MRPDVLKAIIAEAAEEADFATIVEVEPDLSWVCMTADERPLVLEWREDARRLVLTADLAQMPEPADPTLLTALLNYNATWRETGGLRLAIAHGGVATLVLDLPADGLDAQWLSGVMSGFLSAAETWRAALEAPKHGHDAADFAGKGL